MTDSSIARLAGALFSPQKTFTAIRERPTWLVALLVLVVLSLVSSILLTQKMDMEEVVREAVAQRGRQISEEQIEQGIELQEKFGTLFAVAGSVIFLPAGYLLITLIFWVVFKLLGGDFPFKTGFATTVHGLLPGGVAALLSLPVILSRAEFSFADVQSGSVLASNLGALAPEESGQTLRVLLSSLDVFTIWSVILLAIGFAVVAKVSRTTAGVTVVVLWLVWILAKVGWVSIFG